MEHRVRCARRVSGTECKQLRRVAGRGPACLLSEGQLQILAYNLDVLGWCNLGCLVARKKGCVYQVGIFVLKFQGYIIDFKEKYS